MVIVALVIVVWASAVRAIQTGFGSYVKVIVVRATAVVVGEQILSGLNVKVTGEQETGVEEV